MTKRSFVLPVSLGAILVAAFFAINVSFALAGGDPDTIVPAKGSPATVAPAFEQVHPAAASVAPPATPTEQPYDIVGKPVEQPNDIVDAPAPYPWDIVNAARPAVEVVPIAIAQPEPRRCSEHLVWVNMTDGSTVQMRESDLPLSERRALDREHAKADGERAVPAELPRNSSIYTPVYWT